MAVLAVELLDFLLVFLLQFGLILFEDIDVTLHELHFLVYHSLCVLLFGFGVFEERSCLPPQVQEQFTIDLIVGDVVFSELHQFLQQIFVSFDHVV